MKKLAISLSMLLVAGYAEGVTTYGKSGTATDTNSAVTIGGSTPFSPMSFCVKNTGGTNELYVDITDGVAATTDNVTNILLLAGDESCFEALPNQIGGGLVIGLICSTGETTTYNIRAGQDVKVVKGGGGGGVATSVSAAAFPLRGPDGTASAPTYSFTNETNTGWSLVGGRLLLTDGGIHTLAGNGAVGAVVRSDFYFAWSATTDATAAVDTGLQRAAAGVVKPNDGAGNDRWIQNAAGDQFLTGNFTDSDTTPSNISDLTVTVTSGRKYIFELVLFADNATDGSGMRIDFDGGTATFATNFRVDCEFSDTNTNTQTTAIATDITAATITGTIKVLCHGTGEPDGTGTFIPRAADNSGATTLTVFRGSYLLMKDMP